MVYFLGDWGMGDAKYATCNHVSKIPNHEQSILNINLQSPISNDVTSTTATDQTEVLAVNVATTTAVSALAATTSSSTKPIQTVTTVKNIDTQPVLSTSDSDIVFDVVTVKSDQKQHANESQGEQLQHQLHQQQSSQLNQQTLTLSRATELIRQRSSSIHQIQYDDRVIHHYASQQEYDDEVAVHPLSNQVRTVFYSDRNGSIALFYRSIAIDSYSNPISSFMFHFVFPKRCNSRHSTLTDNLLQSHII